ncbi:MAG: acyl carrier protein [Oscillospiraceae bacterium]|nr:acyl carrier protein [Oscillospiraceae bacterium]
MEKIILEILSDLQPGRQFTESSDFIADGYLDSFDIVSLISELEAEFSVIISAADIIPENFMSVDAMCELVKNSEKV